MGVILVLFRTPNATQGALMDGPVSFGGLLRTYRRARDLTQEELARRVARAVTTIKKVEADERRPSRELTERFALVLEVPAVDVPAFVRLARGLLPDAAAEALRNEVRRGRLDGDAVAGMLAAGHRTRLGRRELVGGLSARDVEVLRLMARGHTMQEIRRNWSSAGRRSTVTSSIFIRRSASRPAPARRCSRSNGGC